MLSTRLSKSSCVISRQKGGAQLAGRMQGMRRCVLPLDWRGLGPELLDRSKMMCEAALPIRRARYAGLDAIPFNEALLSRLLMSF